MKLDFLKMSGAGNDFILLDNLDGDPFEVLSIDMVATLCARGTWIGADGLLDIRSDVSHAFRMKYYNSDGKPAEMCGNGARCAVVYAVMAGLADRDEDFHFESDAGVHRARVTGPEESRVWMTPPEVRFMAETMSVGKIETAVSFLDTGVPHAVLVTGGPEDPPFEETARFLRWNRRFGVAGTNVNYLWKQDGKFFMRTWERGVEGETLACGTGAVACAVCAVKLLGENFPVEITTKSGRTLTVGADEHGTWLQGEARPVYRGTLHRLPT